MSDTPKIIKLKNNDERQRVDIFLKKNIEDLSRSRLNQLIRENDVSINGNKNIKPSNKVYVGDDIEIRIPPPIPSSILPEKINLEIVFEDKHLLVVDKPPGMVVHPGAGNTKGTLVSALLYYCRGQLSGIGGVERPGIVHRLDKDTSGLIIVAKTDLAHAKLSAALKSRKIEKKYLALVHGVPSKLTSEIELPIGRHPIHRTKMAVVPRGKTAVTSYKVLGDSKNFSLLSVNIKTGRTHQIRVHLHHIGHPIACDTVYTYGNKLKSSENETNEYLRGNLFRQALHARSLKFNHPISSREISVVSKLPADFKKTLDFIGISFK
ncbi:MAG: RluA family pseudouridine synthase [Nitrospinota bacterium]|nr:RluA family pseudouridine synthase [Nitrospinota bacterium]